MRGIWRTICSQHRDDPLYFWLGVVVALVPAAAGILLLGIAGWFITAAAVAGLTGAFLNIFAPSALIRLFAILRTGGRYGERILTHEATFRFLSRLRVRVFKGVAASGITRATRSGAVLNRLTGDISALDAVYLRVLVPTVVVFVISLGIVFVWVGSAPAILVTGAVFLCLWFLLALRALTAADRAVARRADVASEALRVRAGDFVAGRRDLAVYGGLNASAAHVASASARLVAAEEIGERRSARLVSLSSLFGQVFLAAILFSCIWSATSGEISPAVAVGLVLAAIALPEVVSMLLPGLANLPRTALAAGRTNALLDQEVAGPDDDDCSRTRAPSHSSADKALSFQSVTFCYPGAERPVLQNFSLEIGSQEVVALAGRSGCGKSTVVSLAARLLSPQDGSIWLQGQNIEELSEDALRQSVTVLGQRPYIFNDTVAANLRLAKEDAPDDALWQALEQADLANRIASNPEGLETVLGEGGLGLSGGEQRRLALARAFLKQPALFVLDEMTEGLDERTAQTVLDRFMQMRNSTPVLMIAHKEQELQAADRVVHLSDGLLK